MSNCQHTNLPPIIMTDEEIAESEARAIEAMQERLDRQEEAKRQAKTRNKPETPNRQPELRGPVAMPSDELLTKEQLAERLHVPAQWVYEQTRNRAKVRSREPLPCIHLTPKKLRFSLREVTAWLDRLSEAENGRTR